MELIDHFRKSAGAGWVCKDTVKLTLDNGKPARLRPGQVIYTGDFHVQGKDLALLLDMQFGHRADWLDERPQSISAALAGH